MDAALVAPPGTQEKTREAAAAVATLPDDVVLEILARVDDVAALFRCALSSKRWRALVSIPSFLRRRWPEGARHPCSLLGFFVARPRDTCMDIQSTSTPAFVPTPGSPLRPSHRSLGSFFPRAAGLFDGAVPLFSRSGLLLVHLAPQQEASADLKRKPARLAVCNPLASTWDMLPSLEDNVFSSMDMNTVSCVILTDADYCSEGRPQPLPSYTTFFKVIIILVNDLSYHYHLWTFSSADSSWTTTGMCFQHKMKTEYICGNPVVCQGKVHWLISSYCGYPTLEFNFETGEIMRTQFLIPQVYYDSTLNHEPTLSVTTDGKLSLLLLHKKSFGLQIWTREGNKDSDAGSVDEVYRKVTVLKSKPREITEARYVCMGETTPTLLVSDCRFMFIVNLETGTIDQVAGTFSDLGLWDIIPFEADWPAFFMSRLDGLNRLATDSSTV